MKSIFICGVLCINILSVNKRDTKYAHNNLPVPTVSEQLLIQIDIITHSSIVLLNGTACRIVESSDTG